jgi:hypothetical protein
MRQLQSNTTAASAYMHARAIAALLPIVMLVVGDADDFSLRRYLAKRFLSRVIQAGDQGHDSVEDSVAAMDLALLKAANGPSFGVAEASSTVLVPSFLAQHGGKRVLVIDSSDNSFLSGTSADIVMCASSAAVFHKLADAVGQKGGADFIVGRCVSAIH